MKVFLGIFKVYKKRIKNLQEKIDLLEKKISTLDDENVLLKRASHYKFDDHFQLMKENHDLKSKLELAEKEHNHTVTIRFEKNND